MGGVARHFSSDAISGVYDPPQTTFVRIRLTLCSAAN